MGKKVVTFGEIMLRLSPPGFLRIGQARTFDVLFGGGEANVAASLANYGVPTDYVTRLPNNDLGVACLQFLRQYGIGVGKIVRGGERLGIYFLENGAAQRGSKVIYDRAGSSLATIQRGSPLLAGAYARSDRQFQNQYLTHETDRRLRTLKEVADECQATPNQVILAWMMQTDPPVIPVFGASTMEQMEENLGAVAVNLSESQMKRLNE